MKTPLPPSPAKVEPPPAARGKLVFVVTEDWFFASHFLPMARAAAAMGLDVVVVARIRHHRSAIEATGARVVGFEAERRSLDPLAAGGAVLRLSRILKTERPDIVHCISLKPILVGGAAAALAGIPRRVYALTGLGLLGAKQDGVGRLARTLVRLVIRGLLETRQTVYLFENASDPKLLGLDPRAARVVLVGGAGIDPQAYAAQPAVPGKTLKVAIVARMLWSKGVDVAVEAVRIARQEGCDVTLSLYGAPDPSNPRAIEAATLSRWSRRDGIAWHGATRDVAKVWASHDVACLPSRGGEGLPRTLLEAAASARALVTTDVPGCRDFVRHGLDGLVVAPNDPNELARAFVTLAGDRWLVGEMGASARRNVLAGHTEHDVMTALSTLYRGMLRGAPRSRSAASAGANVNASGPADS